MSPAAWCEDEALPDGVRLSLIGPGAPFEMVTEAVLGTPMRVFANRPANAREVLESGASRHGDSPFLTFEGRSFTFVSILAPVSAVAASLVGRFGIRPGDRVALVSANTAAHAVTAWAVVALGAVVVELNGWWTGAEMAAAIELARPRVVLGDRPRIERLASAGLTDWPVVCLDDDFESLEADGRGAALPQLEIGEDDPLAILFTSGTTGRAKGAVLSHRNHIHMVMQATMQGMVGAARAGAGGAAASLARSCTVGVSPMFHVSGFSVQLIGGPFLGASFVYPPPGRWDPDAHLGLSERHQATAWSLVPTQLWRLLEHPRLGDYDLSSLRRVSGGGSTFQPELWRQVRAKLPQVTRMATGYGMTETCGAGTHHDGVVARDHPDAVGAPVPGLEIEIRRPDGSEAADEERGVIHLRSPSGFLGYWDDPAATAAALDAERWYCTGEVGHLSNGVLFLDSRGPDLIVRGGENVYPIEIENRLIEHPDILEAAVVGREDKVLGQEVVAVVVARPGAALEETEVRLFAGQALAPFKVPARVVFRDELPHNAAGKVLKHQLDL